MEMESLARFLFFCWIQNHSLYNLFLQNSNKHSFFVICGIRQEYKIMFFFTFFEVNGSGQMSCFVFAYRHLPSFSGNSAPE